MYQAASQRLFLINYVVLKVKPSNMHIFLVS